MLTLGPPRAGGRGARSPPEPSRVPTPQPRVAGGARAARAAPADVAAPLHPARRRRRASLQRHWRRELILGTPKFEQPSSLSSQLQPLVIYC